MNSRVGVNMKYLGAVGWHPTALKGNNAGYEQQGWGQLYVGNLQHLLATKRAMNSRVGNNAGYEQQGWSQREVSCGCRLATYSTYRQQCRL